MPIQTGSWFLLAATLAVAQPPTGEENLSHVRVPSLGGDPDPVKLFQKRWRFAKGLEELRKSHPNLLTPDKLKELAKKLEGIDLNDPKLRSQLEAHLRQGKMNLTAEQIEALERMVKEALPEGKLPGTDLPPGPAPNPTEPPENRPEPVPSENPMEPTNPEERERQAEAQAEAARQLGNLARGLQRVAGDLNESPTLKQTFQDLGAMALRHAGERPNGSLSELNAQLTRFNRWSSQGNGWFQKNWPHMRSLDLPRLSAPRLTALSVPWRHSALPGMPSSVGAVGDKAEWMKAVLTAVLVVALVVALGRMLGRFAGRRKESDGDNWQLGPWPVSPAAVRTRGELIRTFEYLSLLRLGRQARTWNHRAIARRLAGERSPERLAAAQLASLYEQARYAPADEPLSAEEMESYRRDLCLLAGVAAP